MEATGLKTMISVSALYTTKEIDANVPSIATKGPALTAASATKKQDFVTVPQVSAS